MDIVGASSRPKLVAAMKRRRKAMGITQKQVARACRITQGTVSRLEQNEAARVTPEIAARIEKWLQKTAPKFAGARSLTRQAA